MAKLNATEINAAIQELKTELTPIKSLHPLYGMRDGKGYLTRYPITNPFTEDVSEESFLPKEWIESFISCGGTFDVNSVYGPSPYTKSYTSWVARFPASQIASWQKEAWRIDFLPDTRPVEKYFTISEDCDVKTLYKLSKGAEVREDFERWGIPCEGRNSWWFVRQWFRFSSDGAPLSQNPLYFEWLTAQATKVFPKWRDYYKFGEIGSNPVSKKLSVDYAKYCVRIDSARDVSRCRKMAVSRVVTTSTAYTVKGAEYLCKKGYCTAWRTSEGLVKVVLLHSGEEVIFTDNNVRVTPRNIAGVKVAKVSKTAFAWEKKFSDHAEGLSIKAAVDTLLGRVGINTLSVSFSMVRKAKGYCLPGTKQWLQGRFSHLYNLLAPYKTWEEVPSELMNTVWEFSSREQFGGKL